MLLPGIALSLLTGLEVVLYSSAGIVAPIIVGLVGAHARNLDNNGVFCSLVACPTTRNRVTTHKSLPV